MNKIKGTTLQLILIMLVVAFITVMWIEYARQKHSRDLQREFNKIERQIYLEERNAFYSPSNYSDTNHLHKLDSLYTIKWNLERQLKP